MIGQHARWLHTPRASAAAPHPIDDGPSRPYLSPLERRCCYLWRRHPSARSLIVVVYRRQRLDGAPLGTHTPLLDWSSTLTRWQTPNEFRWQRGGSSHLGRRQMTIDDHSLKVRQTKERRTRPSSKASSVTRTEHPLSRRPPSDENTRRHDEIIHGGWSAHTGYAVQRGPIKAAVDLK